MKKGQKIADGLLTCVNTNFVTPKNNTLVQLEGDGTLLINYLRKQAKQGNGIDFAPGFTEEIANKLGYFKGTIGFNKDHLASIEPVLLAINPPDNWAELVGKSYDSGRVSAKVKEILSEYGFSMPKAKKAKVKKSGTSQAKKSTTIEKKIAQAIADKYDAVAWSEFKPAQLKKFNQKCEQAGVKLSTVRAAWQDMQTEDIDLSDI